MIGVFDSGFGGLTILKHFLKELPQYDYIYLGDNARAPYGSKSQDLIYEYTRQAVDFLFSKNCQLIILACNTASAQALRRIQGEYLPVKYPDRRVLGVIRPLVEEVSKENIKKVGMLGTRATVNSHVYKKELKKINSQIEIVEKEASLLVPLIEEGWIKKSETKTILKKYLAGFKTEGIQSLILGCTHYPLLLDQVKVIMGKRCHVYDPGEIVAKSFKDYLARHSELGIIKTSSPALEFFTTDDTPKFIDLGSQFLDRRIEKVEKVSLQ